MIAVESRIERCAPAAVAVPEQSVDGTLVTVKVYTRHTRTCPKRDRSDWARCNCVKWLYMYRDGKDKSISAKTRSWERAEQKAREIRDSFDPIKQLQRQLESKTDGRNLQVEVAVAVDQFLHEVARLNRAEALMSQLDVANLRRWIHSWTGAPTTLHNQHQRVIAFFNFCIEQGWLKENPAKKIKKVPRQQEETLSFTREQYDALIEATYQYDGRGDQRNGQTTNSRRARAYLKLLRWSGLRAGDAACLAKSKLRDDNSLIVYQAKARSKTSGPVCVLLPHKVAQELRRVPPGSVTHPIISSGVAKASERVKYRTGRKSLPKLSQRRRRSFPSCSSKPVENLCAFPVRAKEQNRRRPFLGTIAAN